MTPELKQLLEAYYEKRTCPPEEKPNRGATFERLLNDALARKPGVSRDELVSALAERYAGSAFKPSANVSPVCASVKAA